MEEDLEQRCVESGLRNYKLEVGGEMTRSRLKCKIIRTRDEDGELLNNLEIVASPPGSVSVGVNKHKTGKYSSHQQLLFRFFGASLYRSRQYREE